MSNRPYNSKSLGDELQRVVQAARKAHSVRACLLMTRDRESALNLVKEVCSGCECPLYHFTVAGRYRYHPGELRWQASGGNMVAEPFSLLQSAQGQRGGGVVVLEDCAAFLRDDGGDSRMRMLLAQMLCSETSSDGLILVFLEPPEVEHRLPSILADQFVRLELPYPRMDELDAIAREEIALAVHRERLPMALDRIQKEAARMAPGIVGLTRSAARDAVRDALASSPNDLNGAYQRLQERKCKQLRRELAMNVLDTEGVEEPIGLDYLVEYLATRKNKMSVIGAGRARGVLLIGPPGTGKTMLARAIGRMVQLPVVEFRISALMNSLLGETERRFSQAFATLEAMAPNVVFIDEIEKAFGDSSERDGGTMMRCTGALLSWLSDNPYPNFIVATSNNLHRMGEIGLTMTRSERFDASFFVDVPNRRSRKKMLRQWLSARMKPTEEMLEELAEKTERFSGADLHSVIKQAADRAEYQRSALNLEILQLEIERKRMRALALYDEFENLRRWGGTHCDPAAPSDD